VTLRREKARERAIRHASGQKENTEKYRREGKREETKAPSG